MIKITKEKITPNDLKLYSFIKELRTSDSRVTLLYHPVLLLRKLSYSIIMITLRNYPGIQVHLIVLSSFANLLYLILCQPFYEKRKMCLEIFNETIIYAVACTFLYLCQNQTLMSYDEKMNVGYLQIALLSSMLMLNLVYVTSLNLITIYAKIKAIILKNRDQHQSVLTASVPRKNDVFEIPSLNIEKFAKELLSINKSNVRYR